MTKQELLKQQIVERIADVWREMSKLAPNVHFKLFSIPSKPTPVQEQATKEFDILNNELYVLSKQLDYFL